MINAANYLQINGVFHGDYRPETIYIQEEFNSGTIYIADNGLIAYFKNSYERCISGEKAYLTTFLLECLERKEIRPIYNVYNSDIFAIGMVLLYAATLKDPLRYFYDWEKYQLNLEIIEYELTLLEKSYSVNFIELIRAVMNFERKNLSFFDISQYEVGYF